MFHASGGGALSSEVLRHAERGRRADFDSAHMFLARYQIKDAPPRKQAPQVEPDPDPEPVAEPEIEESAAPKAVIPAAVSVENEKLFAESVRFLRRRGDGLATSAAELGEGNCNALVAQCVSAVEHLMDTFSQDESGCEASDAFIDDLSEAADMMILMQAEAGDAPAADAVTLLLQLRREMEMQLAA